MLCLQNGHHHHQSSRFVSHRSAQSHRQNRPSPSTSTTPKPTYSSSNSGPPPHHHFDPAESISNWAKFKRLWKSGGEKERAQLLVQNVNMNPNSTWSAQVNKYTIGWVPMPLPTINYNNLWTKSMGHPNILHLEKHHFLAFICHNLLYIITSISYLRELSWKYWGIILAYVYYWISSFGLIYRNNFWRIT
jgi:hypothetical protein